MKRKGLLVSAAVALLLAAGALIAALSDSPDDAAELGPSSVAIAARSAVITPLPAPTTAPTPSPTPSPPALSGEETPPPNEPTPTPAPAPTPSEMPPPDVEGFAAIEAMVVEFERGSSEVGAFQNERLDEIANALNSMLPVPFAVIGSTDSTPTLTAARLSAVSSALIGRGVDPSRILPGQPSASLGAHTIGFDLASLGEQ